MLQSLENKLSNRGLEKRKKNFEIVAILNRYKNSFSNLIDNSNLEFLSKLIDKRLCNVLRFRNGLIGLLKENCLNKNIFALDRLLLLVLKTENF